MLAVEYGACVVGARGKVGRGGVAESGSKAAVGAAIRVNWAKAWYGSLAERSSSVEGGAGGQEGAEGGERCWASFFHFSSRIESGRIPGGMWSGDGGFEGVGKEAWTGWFGRGRRGGERVGRKGCRFGGGGGSSQVGGGGILVWGVKRVGEGWWGRGGDESGSEVHD